MPKFDVIVLLTIFLCFFFCVGKKPFKCEEPGCSCEGKQPHHSFPGDIISERLLVVADASCDHGALGRHVRAHGGAKPTLWEGCGIACSDHSNLARHYATHLDVRAFPCPEPGCTYAAAQKGSLDAHVSRDFDCPGEGCKYSAKTRGDLLSPVKRCNSPGAAIALTLQSGKVLNERRSTAAAAVSLQGLTSSAVVAAPSLKLGHTVAQAQTAARKSIRRRTILFSNDTISDESELSQSQSESESEE